MGCACGGCNTCGGSCRGVKSDCKPISNYDIFKMDLCDVEKQLVKKGWSTEKVLKTKLEYLEFLLQFQNSTNDRSQIIPPTQDVDDFWHQHILNTFKYEKDCLEFLGFFLHHYPHTDSCIQDYVIQEKASQIWESKGKIEGMYDESYKEAELRLKQELAMLNRLKKFELQAM